MCQDFEILLGILSFLLVGEDTRTCEDFKIFVRRRRHTILLWQGSHTIFKEYTNMPIS